VPRNPFKNRKKPNVYYDEDKKFILHRRTGKVYDYVEITGWIKTPVSIEDYDKEVGDFYEIECEGDKPLDVLMGISGISDLRQIEYLVLSLMGYECCEMVDILNAKNVGVVRQIASSLKDSIKETPVFSL
jgi:hypothetical protein